MDCSNCGHEMTIMHECKCDGILISLDQCSNCGNKHWIKIMED